MLAVSSVEDEDDAGDGCASAVMVLKDGDDVHPETDILDTGWDHPRHRPTAPAMGPAVSRITLR